MEPRIMFSYFLLLSLMVDVAYDSGPFLLDRIESLYPAYDAIHDAVCNQPKLVFKIRQTFFPVMNYRYWQVDGAEIIPIDICLTFKYNQSLNQTNVSNTNEEEQNSTTCWRFQWTNSLLMNLIPGDILLAMDPTFTIVIYSALVDSYFNRRLHLDILLNGESLRNNDSLDVYEQALALFLCSTRADISSSPDRRQEGYIARWYTYFNSDSYFTKLSVNRDYITYNFITLWITFALLNILIPIISVKRGKQIFQKLKVIATTEVRVYRTILLLVLLLNMIYIVAMTACHINGYPTILSCYLNTAIHPCSTPTTETSYYYILGILITKAVILPVALMVEFVAAVYIAKESTTTRFTLVVQTFVIWQLLVFVQITVGLLSIPFLVLMFISPAFVLLQIGLLLVILVFIGFILTAIPLPNRRKCKLERCIQTLLSTAETVVIAALAVSACVTYYVITRSGMNMSGVKGYIVSLIPTIFITIFVWIIKKKFFGQTHNKKKRIKRNLKGELKDVLMKRRESLSTEEETIDSTDQPEI